MDEDDTLQLRTKQHGIDAQLPNMDHHSLEKRRDKPKLELMNFTFLN